MRQLIFLLLIGACLSACKKDNTTTSAATPTPTGPQLTFGIKFDSTLARLGNLGQPVSVPVGNAAQNPVMKKASIHYIEFASDSLTALGSGAIVYQGAETTAGGSNAVDFDKAILKGNNTDYVSVNLSTLPAGTYTWLRVSLTYQMFDLAYRFNNPPNFVNADLTGSLASFVGFNNYITTHKIIDSTIAVNANKVQGYWAFETSVPFGGTNYGSLTTGEGAGVTVVNPISTTSPVPAGSCVVTGKLASPLVITGNETSDIKVVLAFSTNNSFEWKEVNVDGKYEPGAGETVVDMGLRGLHPYVE